MRVNVTNGAFMNWPENAASSRKCSEWFLSSEPLVLNWTTLMDGSNRRKNSQAKCQEVKTSVIGTINRIKFNGNIFAVLFVVIH